MNAFMMSPAARLRFREGRGGRRGLGGGPEASEACDGVKIPQRPKRKSLRLLFFKEQDAESKIFFSLKEFKKRRAQKTKNVKKILLEA